MRYTIDPFGAFHLDTQLCGHCHGMSACRRITGPHFSPIFCVGAQFRPYGMYLFFTVDVSLLAGFVDFLVLSSSSATIKRSCLLKLFLAVALLTLSWWPYAAETSDLSIAQFPETFRNTTMQLSWLHDKLCAFSTEAPGATVSYNFQNRTYTLTSMIAFPVPKTEHQRELRECSLIGPSHFRRLDCTPMEVGPSEGFRRQ